MPESVRDRCTKAHEYLFLLAKSKKYYFDMKAISEPAKWERWGAQKYNKKVIGAANLAKERSKAELQELGGGKRNRRSVWTVATKPFKDAHFATFPEALVRPCILAGTSLKGCCAQCGASWVRIMESVPATSKDCPKTQDAHEARGGTGTPKGTVGKSGSGRINGYTETLGWKPSCECPMNQANVKPCTVLDPFGGAMTTMLVARDLNCKGIAIELNAEYIEIGKRRLSQDVLEFAV